MWNSILAGIVYEHTSIESLRRELSRNAQLREMCGFNPILGAESVPSKSSYNRFLSKLVGKRAVSARNVRLPCQRTHDSCSGFWY